MSKTTDKYPCKARLVNTRNTKMEGRVVDVLGPCELMPCGFNGHPVDLGDGSRNDAERNCVYRVLEICGEAPWRVEPFNLEFFEENGEQNA